MGCIAGTGVAGAVVGTAVGVAGDGVDVGADVAAGAGAVVGEAASGVAAEVVAGTGVAVASGAEAGAAVGEGVSPSPQAMIMTIASMSIPRILNRLKPIVSPIFNLPSPNLPGSMCWGALIYLRGRVAHVTARTGIVNRR